MLKNYRIPLGIRPFVCFLIFLAFPSETLFAQTDGTHLEEGIILQKLDTLDVRRKALLLDLELAKMANIRAKLLKAGLPKGDREEAVVWHKAMVLDYCESFEQPKWVAHIIIPEIINGLVSRTNDFRPDSLVQTGSSVEEDYFLKFKQPDGSYKYDGFGYDRGHLAPSADFRWSYQALSESYLYSNISPQLDSFNRGIWGDLEDKLREYVVLNPETDLYVVTGPVLNSGLKRIEKGVNKVAIPEYYWKVALDLDRGRSIGFVMPNKACYQPLESFAVTVDSVERLTGLEFWPSVIQEKGRGIISQRRLSEWFSEIASGDVEPVPMNDLKRGQINTVMAKQSMGGSREMEVVGKVVSTRISRAGNVLLNLDKQYPREIFTIFIRKENLINFSYDPAKTLKGMDISIKGKIGDLGGVPTMYLEREKGLLMKEN